MKKKIISALLILAILLAAVYYFIIRERYLDNLHTPVKIENYSKDLQGVEALIDWYYETYHIPAISAGIIENGKVVKYISRGSFTRQNKKKVDEHSYYQIASTSKTFTGIIVKSLELEGKLDVDKKIINFLGNKLSAEAQKKLGEITLRQVLYHRSGLGRSWNGYSEEDLLKALNEEALEFQPNEIYQYSNFGYALITYLMEQETNKTYRQLLKEYVSERYDLPDLEVDVTKIAPENLVTPYWKHFRLRDGRTIDFGLQVGGGGIFTNTKTLSQLAVKQMEAYEQFDSLKNSSPLILTHPKGVAWQDNFYGYGLFEFNYEFDDYPEITITNLEHGGDADGFACIYDYFPAYKNGVVVQTSSGGKWLYEMIYHLNGLLVRKYLEEHEMD